LLEGAAVEAVEFMAHLVGLAVEEQAHLQTLLAEQQILVVVAVVFTILIQRVLEVLEL
jgi:hypothetical protein